MATHSSILAWRILETEEPGGQEADMIEATEHACLRLTTNILKYLLKM